MSTFTDAPGRKVSAPRQRFPWLLVPAAGVLLGGYGLPLLVVVFTSVNRGKAFSLAAYQEIFSSTLFLEILGRTFWMSSIVTFLCALLAYPVAYHLAFNVGRARNVVLALITVPYLSSVLIRSYSWISILGNSGIVNETLIGLGLTDGPLPLIFSRTGSYVGMVHVLLPMMVLPLYASLARIDPLLAKAGNSLGAGPATSFWTIVLPLSRPGLVAGSALVFLCGLGFYITPAMLGAPGDYLLAQAIEVRVSTLGDFDTAAALACTLLLIVTMGLYLFREQIVSLDSPGSEGRSRLAGGGAWDRSPNGKGRLLLALLDSCSILARPALNAWLLAVLLFLLAPMIVVVMISFSSAPYLTFPPPGYSLRWFSALFADVRWRDAGGFSVAIAVASAATAVAVGAPFSLSLARGTYRGRRILWLAAVTPMIMPHIVLGLGLLFTLVKVGLNGTAFSFWLAYTVIGLPYVVVILTAAISRFDVMYEKAALSLGARPIRVFATVTLPILASAFASAFLFAFLSAFDDVILSMFLSSPRRTTLTMLMWEDIRLEISPKTAVVGAVQLAILLAAIPAFHLFQRHKNPV